MQDDPLRDVEMLARIPSVPAILDVVCATTGMGFAAVARVTNTRWIACSVKDRIDFGLKAFGELEVATTICRDVRVTRRTVVIDDTATDAQYRDHPTPKRYGFRSYISVPIILPDGEVFGTLCAIDPQPHQLSAAPVETMFQLFAELIAGHVDQQRRLEQSEARLSEELAVAQLREQFIAVLGHDLRSPLASIDAGARLLERSPLDPRGERILRHIQDSVLRMSGLITNILDFARGRLGGGLPVAHAEAADLPAILTQVVAEHRVSDPGRRVDLDCEACGPVVCDAGRIGQLFSNLLANALTHGTDEAPVRVRAATASGMFALSVWNAGPPIPQDVIPRLFQPFSRGAAPATQGLGLGLFIACEIARAHGGTIRVESGEGGTEFTFRMQAEGGTAARPDAA